MPKFMKDKAIALLDAGIETYLLALYGLNVPSVRARRTQDIKFAPIMGLFGASTELLVKACLVQAKGLQSMYHDDDPTKNIYKFGSAVLDELKKEIRAQTVSFSFLWHGVDDPESQRKQLLFYLDKFKLIHIKRADGLHAGVGCSRDVAVITANDVYDFVNLLSHAKKLRAYLKNVPAPEATIRDREAIIEDLSRRFNGKKERLEKLDALGDMYLVLPYVPDIAPDWMQTFEQAKIVPPTNECINYLARTLSDAHSIYLLKNRGGKEGLPVKIDPNNPDALPISIQNIKRTLSTIPDQFNNDILTANTRLEQNRLDLPIDDFLIDLFALSLDEAGIFPSSTKSLTAQQAWPFIVSAFSVQGTPRPCMEFILRCDERNKLISFIKKAKGCCNGHYKKHVDFVVKCINALEQNCIPDFSVAEDRIFSDAYHFYVDKSERRSVEAIFTPQFIKKYPIGEVASSILQDFIGRSISVGMALENMLKISELSSNEKAIAHHLMNLCTEYTDRNGLYSELTSFPFSSTTIPFTISAQGLGIFMPANISGQIEITSLSFKKLITAKFLLFFPLYLQFVPIIQALTNTFIFITPNQIHLHNHSTTPL